MTATFHVGDAVIVMNTLPEKSVDLILTSPPFLALRSYLPPDHPDKALEGGSQATPGAYVDWLLDVVEACARVLAPHGSLCFELGDTYSGSGGAGGDYGDDGLREGQSAFIGSARRGGSWPLAKSLTLIPESFRFAMVYGHNPHTGRTTPPWRLRNVIRWVRPNPPVGALGDKFRPATSELMVFCKAKDRFFDLDAVREPHKIPEAVYKGRPATLNRTAPGQHTDPKNNADRMTSNAAGAPPLDWWNIPPGGYSGFTTLKTKVPVDPSTFDGFAGDIQCIVSADCPVHGDQSDSAPTESHDGREAIESNRNPDTGGRPVQALTLDFAPTDQPPSLNPEDGSSDSPLPQSTLAATPRSKPSRKKAPVPATSPLDTPSEESPSRIDDTSGSLSSGGPSLDNPENRNGGADPSSLGPETAADTDRISGQPSACTCSFYVEKANNTSHYAVWPPELLIKPIKAMCPEKVCRRCGQPSVRVSNGAYWRQEELATHIKDRREAVGVATEEINGWFGFKEIAKNWERTDRGGRIPSSDVWPVLKERLGLSDEFDAVIRYHEQVEYLHVSDYPSGWTQEPDGRVNQRLDSRKERIAPDRFSDCGHDDYRPGLVLDPFAGSGTTLSVATGHGRDAIGIDLDERNYDLALERVGPLILERGEVRTTPPH